MIDEDLIHREIDGEATPEESRRLREELEQQPEARARYDEMVRLVRTLEAVPAAEPPLGLVAEVMRLVRAKVVPASALSRFFGALRQRLVLRPVLGLSLTFATGLLVGTILAGLGDLGPLHFSGNDGSAAATMLGGKDVGLHEIDRASITGNDFRGEASAWASGDQVEVRVHLEGQPPRELTVTCDSGSLHVDDARPGDYVLKLVVRKGVASPVEVALGRGPDRIVTILRVPEGS